MEKEIRILPMSKKEEFPEWDYAQMQIYFFMGKLKQLKKYRYHSKKMTPPPGSIVLFQFDNKIIASAIYLDTIEEKSDDYNGYYKFDLDSIKIFNPIPKDELIEELQLDKNFKFGQGLQNLQSEVYSKDELINKIKILINKKNY